MHRPQEHLPEWSGGMQDMRSPAIDDAYVDLVCHDSVVLHRDTASTEWCEDTYFFCSPFCRQRFRATPSAFVPPRGQSIHSQIPTRGFHATA